LIVRALLEPQGFARAYGGNIAVMDVYAAQDVFGRGRRFDRIDVRLGEGATPDAAAIAIRRAIGSGYAIDTPAQRGADLERAAATLVGGFDLTSLVALGVGVSMIFTIFAIAVERRRRDIGILRTIGATPWQVAALFLCEAAVLGAIGAVVGLAAGRALAAPSHRAMNIRSTSFTGSRIARRRWSFRRWLETRSSSGSWRRSSARCCRPAARRW
jgi:putative ABC transport system permease protein